MMWRIRITTRYGDYLWGKFLGHTVSVTTDVELADKFWRKKVALAKLDRFKRSPQTKYEVVFVLPWI